MANLTLNNLARFQSKLNAGNDLPVVVTGKNRLPLDKIVFANSQPRKYFSSEDIDKLKASLESQGLLNPIIVRPISGGRYELVAGERRLRAASALGWPLIEVNILELDDNGAKLVSLVENLQREDLNPLEQTEGILALLEWRLNKSRADVIKVLYRLHNEHTGKVATKNVFGSSVYQEIQQTFTELGQLDWISFVVTRLPLLNLPDELLRALREGKIAYTKAKAIATVKDEALRSCLLQEAIDNDLSLSEIKAKIKTLINRSQSSSSDSTSLKDKWKQLSRQLNQANLWEQGEHRDKLELLLGQIETLLKQSG